MIHIKSNKNPKKLSKRRVLNCPNCNKSFSKHISPSEIESSKRYCSKECSRISVGLSIRNGETRKCSFCNKDFYSRKSQDRRGYINKYCSLKCRIGNKKGNFTDGFYLSSDGYCVMSKTPDGRKQIKYHRYLMECHIGRKLKPTEIVHHINEDKLDNSINNLQIVSRSEHNKIHRFLC